MSAPGFDPNAFLEFDVPNGVVKTRDGQRVVVLSDEALGSLARLALQSGDASAMRALGLTLGAHTRAAVPARVGDATPEDVLGSARAVLSVFGWGALDATQWGSAVVLALRGAPSLDAERLGVAALLGGLLSSLAGNDVACVPVGADFVVVDPSVANQVFELARGGANLAHVVGALHGGGAA